MRTGIGNEPKASSASSPLAAGHRLALQKNGPETYCAKGQVIIIRILTHLVHTERLTPVRLSVNETANRISNSPSAFRGSPLLQERGVHAASPCAKTQVQDCRRSRRFSDSSDLKVALLR